MERGKQILALFSAVLITAAGLRVPKWMLEQQKTEMMTRAGTATTKEFAVFGYSQIHAEAIRTRIARLSDGALCLGEEWLNIELVAEEWTGEGNRQEIGEHESVGSRAPLDTEFDGEEAAQSANMFLQKVDLYCEEYGCPWDPWNGTENAVFATLADDTSLSLWWVELWDDDDMIASVLLDALSGIPFYVSLSTVIRNAPQEDDFLEIIFTAAQKVYNMLYSFSFPLDLPVSGQAVATDGSYTLQVTAAAVADTEIIYDTGDAGTLYRVTVRLTA